MLAIDGQNVELQEQAIIARLSSAKLGGRTSDAAGGIRSIDRMIAELEDIAAKAPSDRFCTHLLSQAWRQKGEIQLAAGTGNPADSAGRAIAFAKKLPGPGANSGEAAELVHDEIFLGQVLDRASERTAAQAEWIRAKALLDPRVPGTRDWRILDPYARTLDLLGQFDAAGAIINRLRQQGYVPRQPWPASALAAANSPSVNPSHN